MSEPDLEVAPHFPNNLRRTQPVQIEYAVVIRAYESTPMLVRLMNDLRLQTVPPQEIIIVDASPDRLGLTDLVATDVRVVPYPPVEFNYSKALNIGIAAHDQPFTMNLSCHIELYSRELVDDALKAAATVGAEIVFVVRHLRDDAAPGLISMVLRKGQHNGYNGISNSMSIIPSALLKERPFREEVFAAEDQEWTKYYLERFDRPILGYCSTNFGYKNAHEADEVAEGIKMKNIDIAIGYFVNPRLLRPPSIAKRLAKAALAMAQRKPRLAMRHASTAFALIKANFVKPQRSSRYF